MYIYPTCLCILFSEYQKQMTCIMYLMFSVLFCFLCGSLYKMNNVIEVPTRQQSITKQSNNNEFTVNRYINIYFI